MNKNTYTRKIRQLKYAVKLLKTETTKKIKVKLIKKIRRLLNALNPVLPGIYLRKLISPALIALGLIGAQPIIAQQFADPITNPFGLNFPDSTDYLVSTFADIDGDGDLDILTHDYYGEIDFFQNTGDANNPNYEAPIKGPFNLTLTDSIFGLTRANFEDLDNDGDLDLFLTSPTDDGYATQYIFKENIGTATAPDFATQVNSPFGLNKGLELNTRLVDADGDGDLDLFSIGIGDNYVFNFLYHENIGTASEAMFGVPVINPFGLDVPPATFYNQFDFVDIDLDGDLDMLISQDIEVNEDYVIDYYFYENTGDVNNMQLAMREQDPYDLNIEAGDYLTITAADLDGDGNPDLLFTFNESGFIYYENTGTASNKNLVKFDFKIVPNPASEYLNVISEEPINYLEIFDMQGKLILTTNNVNEDVPIQALNSGNYLLKITDQEGKYGSKLFFKK